MGGEEERRGREGGSIGEVGKKGRNQEGKWEGKWEGKGRWG